MISFSILIYVNYNRFTESEITSMSIYAYQTSYNAKSIIWAPVSFPLSAFNRNVLYMEGIREVLQIMLGIMQMWHHFYHEFLLFLKPVTLFNCKYAIILWL